MIVVVKDVGSPTIRIRDQGSPVIKLLDSTGGTSPVVSSFSPSAGSQASNVRVHVTFAQAMDATTITTSSVQLFNGVTPVSCALVYDPYWNRATLTPNSLLADATTYTIQATTACHALGGSPLATNATQNFTTDSVVTFGSTPSPGSWISPTTGVAYTTANGQQVATLTSANTTYTLQSSIRGTGCPVYVCKGNVKINLNGHTIYFGSDNAEFDHGVWGYNDWDTGGASYQYPLGVEPAGAASPDGMWVQGPGSVVDEGSSARVLDGGTHQGCHAIGSRQVSSLKVDSVNVLSNGDDSFAVYNASGTGACTITNNFLESNSFDTPDRQALPSSVFIPKAACTITSNVVLGQVAAFNVGSNSVITNNWSAQGNTATNGYACTGFGTSNVTYQHNISTPFGPHGGPGVIINGAYNNPSDGWLVDDNVILHSDATNAEYGSGLNAAGVRIRWSVSNMTVTNNLMLGLAGVSGVRSFTACSGFSFSIDGSWGDAHGQQTITGNTCYAVLYGSPDSPNTQSWASAFSPIGDGEGDDNNASPDIGTAQPTHNTITGNNFYTNHYVYKTDWSLATWCHVGTPVGPNNADYVNGATAATAFIAGMRAKSTAIGMDTNVLAQWVAAQAAAMIHAHCDTAGLQATRAAGYLQYGYPNQHDYTVNGLDATIVGVQLCFADWTWNSVDPATYVVEGSFGAGGTVGAKHVLNATTVQVKLTVGGSPVVNSPVTVATDQSDNLSYPQLKTDGSGLVRVPVVAFGIDKAFTAGASFSKTNRVNTTINAAGKSSGVILNTTLLGASQPYTVALS